MHSGCDATTWTNNPDASGGAGGGPRGEAKSMNEFTTIATRRENFTVAGFSLFLFLVSFFFLRLPDVSFHPFLFRFKFLLAPLFIFLRDITSWDSRRFKTIQFVFPLLTIYKKKNVSRIKDNFSLRHVINMERLKNNRVRCLTLENRLTNRSTSTTTVLSRFACIQTKRKTKIEVFFCGNCRGLVHAR